MKLSHGNFRRLTKQYDHISNPEICMVYDSVYGIYISSDITSNQDSKHFFKWCSSIRAFRRFLRKQSCFNKSGSEFRIWCYEYKNNIITYGTIK